MPFLDELGSVFLEIREGEVGWGAGGGGAGEGGGQWKAGGKEEGCMHACTLGVTLQKSSLYKTIIHV